MQLFREKHSLKPGQPKNEPSGEEKEETSRAVLCHMCRSVLTYLRSEVSIHGRHLHTFFNPAGIVYEIRCFSEAPGCVTHGKPTDEFTWFSGFTWEYCLCGTCFDHLGWFYKAPDSSFFGLINAKLIIDEPLS